MQLIELYSFYSEADLEIQMLLSILNYLILAKLRMVAQQQAPQLPAVLEVVPERARWNPR